MRILLNIPVVCDVFEVAITPDTAVMLYKPPVITATAPVITAKVSVMPGKPPVISVKVSVMPSNVLLNIPAFFFVKQFKHEK